MFKHALMAAALAVSSFAATAATTLSPYEELSFDRELVTAGVFSHTYDFEFAWAGPGIVQGSVSELKFGKLKDISFGVGALQIFDANDNLLLSLDGLATGTQSFDISVLDAPLAIPTSAFTVVLKGTAIGTGPGTLGSYDFSLQAAPVPEAQTYAMVLAGLGVAGLVMRRRSNNA